MVGDVSSPTPDDMPAADQPVDRPWAERSDGGLSAANARFYQALETADLDLMIDVWSHDDTVSCAHPGRAPLIGWASTAASWTAIFASGGNPQVIVTEERVVHKGDVGWVTVTENMISEGHTGAAGAINVFEHDGDRWLMVAHHAAPVLSVS